MIFRKDEETKRLLRQAILLATDSIREDICNDNDPDNNIARAEAIKRLIEAYKNIE